MHTIEYATFRYDTVKVENGFNTVREKRTELKTHDL